MAKAPFVRYGIHPATQTPLFVAELPSFEALGNVDLPTKPITLFLAGDTSKVSPDKIGRVAETFLNEGVRFVCAWGEDCKRVHDIFDEVYIGDGTEPYNFHLMTSWHDDDSFGEALWFFLNCAHVDEEIADAASFAVRIGDPTGTAPIGEAIQRIDEFNDLQ